MKAEAFEGRYFHRGVPLTVNEAWQNYERSVKDNKRSFKTDSGRAEHFLDHFGHRKACTLTFSDIDRYREKRKAVKNRYKRTPSTSSVNREISLLRHILNHAVKYGDLDRNPLAGVQLVKEDNIRKIMIEEPEFDTLIDKADEPLKPILLMAYDTGMRKNEILKLRWDQVSMKHGTVRLEQSDTKTSEPRVIVLSDRVIEELKKLPRSVSGYVFINPKTGQPWNQIQKMFHRARKAAKLERIWFHDLRRSFVTIARRRGVPESVVMKMSGHKTRSVFERYNIVSEEDLRAAVALIQRGREENAEADKNRIGEEKEIAKVC